MAALKYSEDFTECSVCCRSFTDPRELPCIHTFCLKCIEEWAEKLKLDEAEKIDKLACPLCGKKMDVPEGGLAALPRNSFLQQLLEVKELAASLTQSVCDVCSEGTGKTTWKEAVKVKRVSATAGGKGDTNEEAVVYCIDCRKNMCKNCCGYHEKFRFNSSHTLIELDGQQQDADELVQQFPDTMCDKHKDKNLEIYCVDCKVAVCYMCHIKSHKSHECSDVKEVAEDLSNKIKEDSDGIDQKVAECEEMLTKLAADEKLFLENVIKTEKEILDKCEEMKKLIEDHKSKLIAELDEAKAKQVKRVALVRQELEGRLKLLHQFNKYSKELREKGKACDVANSASGVRTRAKELLEFDVYEDLDAERTSVEIKFGSTQPVDNAKLVFGDLKVQVTNEATFLNSTKPVNVIASPGYNISGIAVLGQELFVMRYGQSQQIEVYNTTNFALKRNISANCLSLQSQTNRYNTYPAKKTYTNNNSRGLAACSFNMCLYATNLNTHNIHKMDLNGNVQTQWPVGNSPYGLSVNADHNVLVACYGENTIREYTTDGSLVRQISLQSNITNPTHVLQLPNCNYGITHHGTYHRYCVVDAEGQIVKSFGNNQDSGEGQLTNPYGLAVHRQGSVFIADQNNNRILVLHPESFTAKQLPAELAINAPYCVYLDETRHRLYIGEWGGRVLVLERERENNVAA